MDPFRIERSRALHPLFFRGSAPENGREVADYQHAGAEYILARDNGLIGDEPGVGKTLQGILISNAIRAKRTLVVCPASLRLNWEKEVWMWSDKENVRTYPIMKAKDGVDLSADWVIISYDLLRRKEIMDALLSKTWDHVIYDEAHAIKDPRGNKRTQSILAEDMLPSVAGRTTLLSGTIMPNQPIECYNAVRLLDWDAIDRMSLEDFREYYYAKGEGMVRRPVYDEVKQAVVSKLEFSTEVRNKPRNLEELQARLRGSITVRRSKTDVMPQLPAKRYDMVPLSLTKELRAALRHPGWSQAAKLYELEGDAFNGSVPIDGEISTARRLLGEAKAEPVCDYIEDLLGGGVEKLVVAAHHSSVLKIAKERLAKFGLAYMDGSTLQRKRQGEVEKFMKDPNCRIILGQSQVIGEGHTLTAAQDCLLMEPDWVPGKVEQIGDRIHRKGQAGSYVLIHVPVVPGSLDERIIRMAVDKDASIYKALDKQ
jgi:SWI/SNF-related matrix-associated actin-dependent regulator 1 of chromatin subfamily A